MLHKDEYNRYSRQMMLPELGVQGQQKLKQAKVLVVGAGGLGCPVLQYLTAAGVGNIGIVDDDVVDVSNLHRQILYSLQDIGNKKALVAKDRLQLLNPDIKITGYTERLTGQHATSIIGSYDLVVDGSDNFATRYLVNDICVDLHKPLVFGSIFKFEGQLSVLNYRGGPDYRDLYPDLPGSDEVPNCDEIGVIGVLPGIIGTLMAAEVIKMICGIGDVLSGRLMTVDMLGCNVKKFIFKPRANTVRQPKTAGFTEPGNAKVPELKEIHKAQLKNWLAEKQEPVSLIDVRERKEFDEFNIGGFNIPLTELAASISRIPLNGRIVFCCRSGIRSRQAGIIFLDITKHECYHLKGGILNYS